MATPAIRFGLDSRLALYPSPDTELRSSQRVIFYAESQAFSHDFGISLPFATMQVIITPLLIGLITTIRRSHAYNGLDYIQHTTSPSYIGVARERKSGAPNASTSSSDSISQGHKQASRQAGGQAYGWYVCATSRSPCISREFATLSSTHATSYSPGSVHDHRFPR